MDNTNAGTDSCGNSTANGSVWYKNFTGTGPIDGPIPGTSCWFISAGPYDCRAWIDGSGVNTLGGLFPTVGASSTNASPNIYQKLGTFSGLDLSNAFNGSWQVL
jgi:hypothetical protein